MRTFILVISILTIGMAQQLCALSGAGAALSDSSVMAKLVQSEAEEPSNPSASLDGVLFDVWEKQGAQQSPVGVYYYDLNAEEIIPVLPEGYALQDVSPDQTWMLANQSTNLWLISLDDSTSTLISNSFSPSEEGCAALFVDNNSLVYMQQQDTKTGLLKYEISTQEESSWVENNILPVELQSGNDDGIWVKLQPCDSSGRCSSNEESWLVQDNTISKLTVTTEQFWPSVQNDQIAYANPSINTNLIYFADTLGFSSQQLRLAGDYTLDASWHFDGRRIAVLRLKRDFDTHKVTGIGQHLIDTKTLSVNEYSALNGLAGQAMWRDDETLLVVFTQEETGTFRLAMAETHIQDGSVNLLSIKPDIQSEKMLFVHRLIGMTD